MELKDLLSLSEPTLEQYSEMQRQLMEIERGAKAEIDRLDAEGLARGADRLLGIDDGGEARAVARAAAEQRRSDAENVLADVRGKAASLQARLEKEADEQAWAEVRQHLAQQTSALMEIDALCTKIGELYETVIENGNLAKKRAPVKLSLGSVFDLQGAHPAQVGLAVLSKLHVSIGRPFASMPIERSHFVTTYDSNIHHHGLPNFIKPFHNAVLQHSL